MNFRLCQRGLATLFAAAAFAASDASTAETAAPPAAPYALIPIPGDPAPATPSQPAAAASASSAGAGPALTMPAVPNAVAPPKLIAPPSAVAPPSAAVQSKPAPAPRGAPKSAKPGSIDPALLDAVSQTVRGILVESVPPKIEENKNWGDTRDLFSKVNLRLDAGKLRVKTDTQKVNHGLWKQLVVTPVEPQKNLQFRIVEARSTGPGTLEFAVVASSPLELTARIERWRTGLKMFNFSTDADAAIEMRLVGEVKHEHRTIDGKSYLVFTPTVRNVDLKLTEFDLRRVGPAGGPLVQELGDALTDPLADQLDKHEPKVAEKINAAIAKKQDKLRLPLSLPIDFSGWSWSGK